MGIRALYPKLRTTLANKEHKKYPYLLKEFKNDKNQVIIDTPSNSNPKIKLHNISFHIYILFGLASNKYIFQHFIKAFKIKHCC